MLPRGLCPLTHMKRIPLQLIEGACNVAQQCRLHPITSPHIKAGCLSRHQVLDVAADGILRDPGFEPRLPELVACSVDSHASLVVVHAAQHKVHGATTEAAFTEEG